jgi:glycosyltransferase involved in cell wall biosynthesis
MSKFRLNLVLPCFNPLEGWEIRVYQHLNRLQSLLPDTDIEPILVNDGSQYGVEEKHFAYLKKHFPQIQNVSYTENQGKGFAVREGFRRASAPYILFTDIDFPYEEADFIRMYRKLQSENIDILVGVRQADYYQQTPWYRALISRFLKYLIRKFLPVKISDTQGGLKGFNQKGKQILLKTTINRYLFDLELITIASKTKGIVMEGMPVELRRDVSFASLSWAILRREFLNLLKIFFQKISDGS